MLDAWCLTSSTSAGCIFGITRSLRLCLCKTTTMTTTTNTTTTTAAAMARQSVLASQFRIIGACACLMLLAVFLILVWRGRYARNDCPREPYVIQRRPAAVSKQMPLIAVAFLLAGFGALGLPGTAGFVAEIMVFLGGFTAYAWAAALSAFGVVLAAGYMLWAAQRTMFGPRLERWDGLRDATASRRAVFREHRRASFRPDGWNALYLASYPTLPPTMVKTDSMVLISSSGTVI